MESQRPARRSRLAGLARRVGEVYRQIFRVYRAWWMYILPFALVIVVPVDILDSLVEDRIENLGSEHLGEYVVLATIAGGLSWTSLIGQVFMAGVIGLSVVHAKAGRPPSLTWMARNIRYWQLIVVDLIYLLAIGVGLLLLVVPGFLAFVFFGLAGPVVEFEERGIRSSFARSFRLVRQDFWLAFWVLITAQLGGSLTGAGIEELARAVFGEKTVIDSIAEAASSVVLEPLLAIAIVLLAMRLLGLPPPHVASGENAARPGSEPVP